MPYYKILKMWLIPPGIFILLFLCIAVYFAYCYFQCKDKKLCKILGTGTVACYLFALVTYALSIDVVSQRFLHSVEYRYTSQDVKADAIIVLGGKSPERTKAAINLYKRYELDVIPSGHKGEAERIQTVMMAANVPAERFFLEPKATNTKENAKYILPIALARGYMNVYVVTDAYHMPRSMMIFKKPFAEAGIEVIPYPCGYMTPRKYVSFPEREWVPDIRNLERSTIACHEYLGMLALCISQ